MKKTKKSPALRKDRAAAIVIHVLSDSTGNLAKHMVAAFLTQFPAGTFDVRPMTFLQTAEKIDQALKTVAQTSGIVMHAMVQENHKKLISQFCTKNKIPSSDLTGGFVSFLSKSAGCAPQANLKALHEVSDEYSRRIDALEFTIQHDDGLGAERLNEADVILVGVSRTSKTPTCIYLAQLGYKAANVAIAIESPVPKGLLELKQKKVVGLYVNPERLIELRQSRLRSWSMADTSYVDLDHVQKEVRWSKQLFNSKGWPSLDVTNTAVEETAAKVVNLLDLQR